MQFVAKKENLTNELALIQGVVEKRNTRPILANVLMDIKDDILSLYATDLEVGLNTHFAVDVVGSGSLTAPAKKLADIVKLLPDGSDVSIETLENHFIKINCGKIEYKLAGAPKEDFPAVPKFDDNDSIEIPAGLMKNMINQTIYAITTEETRYALNGAQLAIGDGKLRMVSTDAHRLAFVEFPFEEYSGKPVEILIPRKTVAELKTLIDDRLDSIFFTHTESHLFFKVGRRILDSRTLEGQFPSYQKVIPTENNNTAVMDRKSFTAAINRVSLLSHETSKGIRLNFNSGSLLVSSSNPEIGEAKEEMEIDYEGPEIKVGFNAKYLSDFINTVTTDDVVLDLKDETGAGLLHPGGDDQDSYKYVIMPMRI